MTNRKPTRFTAFLWHRRIGLAALALVIIIAITGLLLNHSEDFELDSRYVDSSLILDWYGLEPEGELLSYTVKGHVISQWQQQVFFDSTVIETNAQKLRGAMSSDAFHVLAFDTEIVLVSDQGAIIERIATRFSKTKQLGSKHQRPVIATIDQQYFMADANIIDWTKTDPDDIHWSAPVAISSAQREALLQAFRGKGLSLERVMLDLHSGRIFGTYGIYVMDAAAIALLWLSLSGLWIWWQRGQKQKTKRHYRKHHRG